MSVGRKEEMEGESKRARERKVRVLDVERKRDRRGKCQRKREPGS